MLKLVRKSKQVCQIFYLFTRFLFLLVKEPDIPLFSVKIQPTYRFPVIVVEQYAEISL